MNGPAVPARAPRSDRGGPAGHRLLSNPTEIIIDSAVLAEQKKAVVSLRIKTCIDHGAVRSSPFVRQTSIRQSSRERSAAVSLSETRLKRRLRWADLLACANSITRSDFTAAGDKSGPVGGGRQLYSQRVFSIRGELATRSNILHSASKPDGRVASKFAYFQTLSGGGRSKKVK